MGQLQEIEPQLIELGYQIVAVSADRPAKIRETLAKSEFRYKLYSDSAANATSAFGIAFRVEEDYVERVKAFDIDIEGAAGNKNHILPVPAVFILDDTGLIKFEYVNPRYQVRIHPEVLLAAATAEARQWSKEKSKEKK